MAPKLKLKMLGRNGGNEGGCGNKGGCGSDGGDLSRPAQAPSAMLGFGLASRADMALRSVACVDQPLLEPKVRPAILHSKPTCGHRQVRVPSYAECGLGYITCTCASCALCPTALAQRGHNAQQMGM